MADDYYGIRWYDTICTVKSMKTGKHGFFSRIQRWKCAHSQIVEDKPKEHLASTVNLLVIHMRCDACKAKAMIQLVEGKNGEGLYAADFHKSVYEEPCTAAQGLLRARSAKRRREDARRARIAALREAARITEGV